MPRGIRGERCRAAHLTACEEDGRELYHGYCAWDWEMVSEDVQERLHWAVEEGTPLDRSAAHRAARDEIEATIRARREE